MTGLVIRNINKYIENNFIKQTWIADSLGVNKMNISNILNEKKRNITLEEISSILEVLDLKFEDVSKEDFDFENTNNMNNEEEGFNYVAYCGDISNEKTKKTVELVLDIVEIIDIFKTANSQASI